MRLRVHGAFLALRKVADPIDIHVLLRHPRRLQEFPDAPVTMAPASVVAQNVGQADHKATCQRGGEFSILLRYPGSGVSHITAEGFVAAVAGKRYRHAMTHFPGQEKFEDGCRI